MLGKLGRYGKRVQNHVVRPTTCHLNNKTIMNLVQKRAYSVDTASTFGTLNVVNSQPKTKDEDIENSTFLSSISNLDQYEGKKVTFWCRIHAVKGSKKILFLSLRSGLDSIQSIAFKKDPEMMTFISKLPRETIVKVTGTIKGLDNPIKTEDPVPSLRLVEMDLEQIHAQLPLPDKAQPFTVADAMLNETLLEARKNRESKSSKDRSGDQGVISQEHRLNNRPLDLRVPAHQAIQRVQSESIQGFRNFLLKHDFVEIHTPKMLGGSSEGGSEIFKVDYFGREACLAQSPQLYKQMAVMGDLKRVFEVGPVFRAENSNTHRHLTEFVGLDMEMTIDHHYHEVLDMLNDMFVSIFEHLDNNMKKEKDTISKQYDNVTPLSYFKKNPILNYRDAIDMLNDRGVLNNDNEPLQYDEDLGTPQERALGAIVKEKYGTDFFILDKYPLAIRPFYTMPDPELEGASHSYDIFLRGEEITSGAQRCHDPELLTKRAIEKGLDPATLKGYIDAFRYGAWPHGGCGIGLERLVMLYLGISNVRLVNMFPRDPKRLYP